MIENSTVIAVIVITTVKSASSNPSPKIRATNSNIDSQAWELTRQNKYMQPKLSKAPTINAATNLRRLIFVCCLTRSPVIAMLKIQQRLHNHRNPLPAANARRGQPVLLLAPTQLIQQRDHQPRSGRSQRMSQRNRSTIHVHLFAIESQFFLHSQILRRERLVHLNQVDVIQSQPRALQRNLRRRHRTAPHQLRIDTRNSPIDNSSQRTQIPPLRL